MSKFIELFDRVEQSLEDINYGEATYSSLLSSEAGAYEIYAFLRKSTISTKPGEQKLAWLPLQQHIFVETCVEEGHLIDACEILQVFIYDGYIPSSELIRKFIEKATAPNTHQTAIVACQHVVTQLKLMLFNRPVHSVAQVDASIMREWDPVTYWKLIQSIIVDSELLEEQSSTTMDSDTLKQMLLKIMVTLVECELLLNPEAAAHAIVGQSSVMERRSNANLWLNWLPSVLKASELDFVLLDTCQELMHTLVLLIFSEYISPSAMLKQLHIVLRALPIDRVFIFIETIKSPTFRCMYLNYFFHNCCSFSDVTSSYRYLAERSLSLIKITRLFFTCRALSHTAHWLQEEHILRLLLLLLTSYIASRSLQQLPEMPVISTHPWLLYGFTEDELASVEDKQWDTVMDRLTSYYDPQAIENTYNVLSIMRSIPTIFNIRLSHS
ncbi:hypothetical protein BDF19DRAFT_443686 [Syncephalis fuscata]|nr:hypothetical protein BDF19DRAFT_443686 [Syncephalis fuscata]